jgi:hypothetical protein
MKTSAKIPAKIVLKKYFAFGFLFITLLGYSQTITTPKTNTICGENSIVTLDVSQSTIVSMNSENSIATYIDSTCTTPYSNQKVSILYLKPNLSQLEVAAYTITLSTSNGIDEAVSEIITIENNTKIWNGGAATAWENPENWMPYGVPTEENCVIIPDSSIVSGTNYNAYAKNIMVKSGGSLEIESENNLTITDWINVDSDGNFTVKNNANLIQINEESNSGNVNIEKTTDPMYYYDYTYWNSPVTADSNFTFEDLSPLTKSDIYSYNTTINGGIGCWQPLSSSEIMIPTKGYIVKAPDTYSTSTQSKTSYTATFTGVPNNGTILIPISKGTDANVSSTISETDDEWNLIGNPYPSAIDLNKVMNLDTNKDVVDGTVYLWKQMTQLTASYTDPFYGDTVLNYTLKDYTPINKTGGTKITSYNSTEVKTNPINIIAVGQSFFIKAASTMTDGTTANITLNNSVRTTAIENKTSKISSDEPIEKNRIWLNLTNNSGAFSQILIGYLTGATQEMDNGYDAESFGGNNVTFYSVLSEKKLTIQGRALPFDDTDNITLGYKAAKKGNYSIRIDHIDGLFENQSIYLVDTVLGVVQDLKESPYTFYTLVGSFDDRFELKYSIDTQVADESSNDATLAVNQNTLNNDALTIYYSRDTNKLNINNDSSDSTIQKVTLYNLLGQSIATSQVDNLDQNNIQITYNNLNDGIYIAKLTTSNGEISKKIIVSN